MFATAPRKTQSAPAGRALHDDHRERNRRRNAELSRQGRDIAPLPKVKKPKRRKKCERDFRCFCETYFPELFYLPWSADHLRVMAKIERAVLRGGLFAVAMPRGDGKTTLCEIACLWAMLYGHRRFVALIGSDEDSALELLDSIKMELEGNDLLDEDFPEVCYPVRRIDGISHRCRGQLFEGKRTQIRWTGKEIVLPTIPGSVASGAVVRVAGITGRVRGMKFKRPDGKSSRPDLVVIDDPQTDESARSVTQCTTRTNILAGAVLGLAEPGKKIAGIMPCTVIRRGDMADVILDPKLHPEWNGERCRMVYDWPTNTKLWESYARHRLADLEAGDDHLPTATAFYQKHRKAMDAGAVVAWEARKNDDEISALQHAVNIKLRDALAFACEYQNDPPAPLEDNVERLTIPILQAAIGGYSRGVVPIGAEHVTAYVDVQGNLLYYLVAAWADDFTGWVLDYGTWPDQGGASFTLATAGATIDKAIPNADLEGRIFGALRQLVGDLCGRVWQRKDDAPLHIRRLLIDAMWGKSTDTVYDFAAQSDYPAFVIPSHGVGIGAKKTPMNAWQKRRGDKTGPNWRIPGVKGGRPVRHVLIDTNAWKTFISHRLRRAVGSGGSLALFKASPQEHQMLFDHILAEHPVEVKANGRTVEEWVQNPSLDNHFFDCLVGAAVAASIEGARLPTSAAAGRPRAKRKKTRLSDLRTARKQARK